MARNRNRHHPKPLIECPRCGPVQGPVCLLCESREGIIALRVDGGRRRPDLAAYEGEMFLDPPIAEAARKIREEGFQDNTGRWWPPWTAADYERRTVLSCPAARSTVALPEPPMESDKWERIPTWCFRPRRKPRRKHRRKLP